MSFEECIEISRFWLHIFIYYMKCVADTPPNSILNKIVLVFHNFYEDLKTAISECKKKSRFKQLPVTLLSIFEDNISQILFVYNLIVYLKYIWKFTKSPIIITFFIIIRNKLY